MSPDRPAAYGNGRKTLLVDIQVYDFLFAYCRSKRRTIRSVVERAIVYYITSPEGLGARTNLADSDLPPVPEDPKVEMEEPPGEEPLGPR